MAAAIAFLDVDHTLTRRSTGYRFALEATSRGILKARTLALIPFLYASYRVGRQGHAAFARDRPSLRGIPQDLLEDAAKAAFEKRIIPDLYPAAIELIAALKAAGLRVVLATSSFDLVIRPVAELLGADAMISSSLEFVDGFSTGRLSGAPAFGENKLELARSYARDSGCYLEDCSFYSDSVHDLPLLLAVGKPVAVNPDRRLAREARARGWESLSFR